jgi:hypothetical protein
VPASKKELAITKQLEWHLEIAKRVINILSL